MSCVARTRVTDAIQSVQHERRNDSVLSESSQATVTKEGAVYTRPKATQVRYRLAKGLCLLCRGARAFTRM